MATIAPDPTASAAPGWLGVLPRDLGAGYGRARSRTASRPPAATSRRSRARRRTTSRARPRPPRPRSRPGPRRATRSAPASCARAAEIYEANREEFGTWTQRETGASHSKMHHESNFAYHEILNAATLPSQAYGSLMPSAVKGRLSMVRRVPAGVIGAITPWNSPSVLGHARRRAGAGARQRGRPQAGSADAGRRRRDVRGRLPRGGPARGPAPGRGRWRRRRRGAGHRPEHPGRVVHRLDGGRAAGRPARRRHAQEGLARARWQQRVHRARRRRPRRGGGRRRLLRVPVPGPGLLRGRPPPRRSSARRRVHRAP